MKESRTGAMSEQLISLKAVASALETARSATELSDASQPLKLASELVLREILALQNDQVSPSGSTWPSFEAVADAIEERERGYSRLLAIYGDTSSTARGGQIDAEQILSAKIAERLISTAAFSLHLLSGGRSKTTYVVRFEGEQSDKADMIVRVDKPFGDYATKVAFEYPLMKSLYDAGIPVPEPLWLELGMEGEVGAFMVMRRMPGTQAAGSIFDAARVPSDTLASHAALLARLHSASPDLWPGENATANRHEAIIAHVDQLERRWNRVRSEAPSEITDFAFGWLRTQSHLIVEAGAASIVHGDPSLQNTLAVNGRINCLIDWEFAHIGDPAEDLAYIRDAVERNMPWPQFMEEYLQAGGPQVSEERLTYFQPWASLRNMVLASELLAWLKSGNSGDYNAVAIAFSTRPRLEALLARHLKRASRSGENVRPT